jgi:hypothetical protein
MIPTQEAILTSDEHHSTCNGPRDHASWISYQLLNVNAQSSIDSCMRV